MIFRQIFVENEAPTFATKICLKIIKNPAISQLVFDDPQTVEKLNAA